MYPTREQAREMATLHDEVTPTSYCGKQFIAMHDVLDTKQAELDSMKVVQSIHRDAANTILDVNFQLQAELDGRTKALDWTANRCDELALEAGLIKIELDKAKDLIRRFVNNDNNQGTMEFSIWWNEMNSIMDEAETLLNEKQA